MASLRTNSGQGLRHGPLLIGAVSLLLVACQPTTQNPVEVTAPVIKDTVSVLEKQPAKTIEDNRTAILKAEIETDNQTSNVITPAQDNQTTDNASVQNMTEDEPKEDEIEIVIVPAPTPAPLPEPEPDPLDPNQFIEKSQSYLSGTLGKPDYQFVQDSVTIAHYNQPACQMLAFLSDVNGTLKVIHIDLRPPFLGEVFYQQACFKQLGIRADEYQSN